MDVLEIDGASHRGIEDIRQINETVGFVPTTGRYKIYIIDEVHMLTKEAFNALLKTLEEPPSHAKFFFATTEAHRIPPTILSRCQRFNLGRVSSDLIQTKLASIAVELGLSVEPEALVSIASLAEGSLRDAESLFDQVIAFQTETISLKTVLTVLGLPARELFFSLDEAGAKGNFSYAFEMAEQLFASGKNVSYVLEELTAHFRTLFLLKQKVPYRGTHPKNTNIQALFTEPNSLSKSWNISRKLLKVLNSLSLKKRHSKCFFSAFCVPIKEFLSKDSFRDSLIWKANF